MSNSKINKPEDGIVFSSGGEHYFLSTSGRLFVQMGFDWRELAIKNALAEMSIQGRPWFVENSLHALVDRNLTHMVLDLESLEWEQAGRLNSLVGSVEHAVCASRGTLLIARKESNDAPSAFWWPNDSDKLYPLQMPSSHESIVAVMSGLGRFVWVHNSGKELLVKVDPNAVPLTLYQSDVPSWAWVAGGVFFLLLGAGTWRVRSTMEGGHESRDIHRDSDADQIGLIRRTLPVHSDVLKLLRNAVDHQFDVQGLDEAFLIGYIETDETRRSRRARMIKDLNVWWHEQAGHELIVRDVDETDKRRRIYRLDPMYDNWYNENAPINDRLT
jgi:hypothetical protein